MKSTKILVVYAKAGGGHESAAKAIKQAVEQSNQGQVRILDMFSSSSAFTQWSFNGAYTLLVNHIPFLWRLLCSAWSVKWIFRLTYWLVSGTSRAQALLIDTIQHFEPDVVVSVYYLAPGWLQQIRSVTGCNFRSVTIVTDFHGPFPTWYLHPEASDFCVFSPHAAQTAADHGVLPDAIHQFDPFFNEGFSKKISASAGRALRTKCGFDAALPTIMISGGGTGLWQTVQILQALADHHYAANIIVIGGRNKQLKQSVERFLATHPHDFHAHVTGFTDQMVELTSLADVVIAKAGPATIFELLAQHKPMILAHYIWPQEKGNMEFIVNNGYGEYITDPQAIATRIIKLFTHPDQLDAMRAAVQSASVRSGMSDLVDYLVEDDGPAGSE